MLDPDQDQEVFQIEEKNLKMEISKILNKNNLERLKMLKYPNKILLIN